MTININTNGPVIRPDSIPKPQFMRSDLRDQRFYAAHEAEILAAAREGRIIDDVSEARDGTREKPRWGNPFGGRVGQ
jgi:hypothetical protein